MRQELAVDQINVRPLRAEVKRLLWAHSGSCQAESEGRLS